MALSTSVKSFMYALSGAPQLTAAVGSLTDLLDAVLVNGFNLKTVSSISVSAGIATCMQNGTYGKYTVVLISGCDEVLLNGEKRVLTSDATMCTFDAEGVADGTYNNAGITSKYAPLGFGIDGTDTNRRWYRSANPERGAVGLYVNDNAPSGYNMTLSVAGVYRSMSYVSQYTDFVSTSSYNLNGVAAWWIKSNSTTDNSARQWAIYGDDRGFYINIFPNNATYSGRCDYFGELSNPTRPNDQYASLCTGYLHTGGQSAGSNPSSQPGNVYVANTGVSLFALNYVQADHKWLCRSHSQIGNGVICELRGSAIGVGSNGVSFSGVQGSAPLGTMPPYPNPVDNGMYLAGNVLVLEQGQGPRGTMPGFYQELHDRALGGNYYQLLENIPSAPGKVFRSMAGSASGSPTTTPQLAATGEVLIDIIGPWR